jgi:hypothetical protein
MRRQFSERRRQRVLAEGDPDAPATPGSGFWKTRSAGARYSNSNTNEEALRRLGGVRNCAPQLAQTVPVEGSPLADAIPD